VKARVLKQIFRGAEPVSGNRLRLLHGGAEFFPALIAAIDAAHTEIHLETYIFNPDASAAAVRDALVARRGGWEAAAGRRRRFARVPTLGWALKSAGVSVWSTGRW
jgi:cardiolipin synthase